MDLERCPECGNLIPDWSHGNCTVCGEARHAHRRYGDRVHRQRSGMLGPVEKRQSTEVSTLLSFFPLADNPDAPQEEVDRTELIERVEHINSLLHDVYREPIRLSKLLQRLGIAQQAIDCWRTNDRLLIKLVISFEGTLLARLKGAMPRRDGQVLIYWYGLGGWMKHDAEAIAHILEVSSAEVFRTHAAFIDYLSGRQGHALLEAALHYSARRVRIGEEFGDF